MVHYAVMNDHLHLIVEADGAVPFVRGVQGLLIRVARALNRVWRRRGKVFKDRYHDHVLATPREVRNAIRYVLNNAEHHERQQGGERQAEGIGLDMFTSAPWFEGWLESVRVQGVESLVRPVARAKTWLLGVGWQRLGRLRLGERAA